MSQSRVSGHGPGPGSGQCPVSWNLTKPILIGGLRFPGLSFLVHDNGAERGVADPLLQKGKLLGAFFRVLGPSSLNVEVGRVLGCE